MTVDETKVLNGTEDPSASPNPPANDGGEKTGDQGTPSPQENKDGGAKVNPDFHQDPAVQEYLNRQWQTREAKLKEEMFAEFEKRHGSKKDDGKPDEIPAWFGGNREQWEAYKQHTGEVITRAKEGAIEEFKKNQEAFQSAQKEANEWFDSEVKSLETDNKTTIDRNKLLEIVIKHELVDSKGRWNYRAAYEILKGATPTQDNKSRKALADATNKDGGGGEPEPKAYKTSDDFRKERPW